MKILVFGKGGQLGKAYLRVLGAFTSDLIVKPVVKYVGRSECDLANEDSLNQLLNEFQPQLVINASAYTAVDKAEVESSLAFAINTRAPELMAQYVAKHGATFLHYSTDYVFDGEKYGYYSENDPCNPLGVYGKSKVAGEEAVAIAFSNDGGGGQYAIFRTSWVYGEGGNFIRKILLLAKEYEELKIIHDQFGVPTSAEWLAQMSLYFAVDENLQIRKFLSGIYHLVPSGEATWYGLACLAVQVALGNGVILKAYPAAIQPIFTVEYPLPAPRPLNSRMSTDKLYQVFEARGDMSKLQLLNQPWDIAVKAYVSNMTQDGLI